MGKIEIALYTVTGEVRASELSRESDLPWLPTRPFAGDPRFPTEGDRKEVWLVQ